jgi:hypothetical protein
MQESEFESRTLYLFNIKVKLLATKLATWLKKLILNYLTTLLHKS